jgi:hypothetical protein
MWHRRFCIDAVMVLLNHQATIYLECNSTYPQNIDKRHLSILSTNDFFVAGMAVALDLHYGYTSDPMTLRSSDIDLWGYGRRAEMITALETFYPVLEDLQGLLSRGRQGLWHLFIRVGEGQESTMDDRCSKERQSRDSYGECQPAKMDLLSNQNWMDGIEEQEGLD